MPVAEGRIGTGRGLLIGPERGAAAGARLRESVSLESLRGDVRSEWEDELTRLGVGAAFAGVEFYAAYLDPSRPSLFDHLREQTVVLDFEPGRQRADARTLLDETAMLAAAEAGGGELPPPVQPSTIEPAHGFRARAPPTITRAHGTGDSHAFGWVGRKAVLVPPPSLPGPSARAP